MTTEELIKHQQQITDKIYQIASSLIKVQGLAGIDAVPDGVPDCAAYLSSLPKVAWILKEVREQDEDGNPSGGGWTKPEEILRTLANRERWTVPTDRRIIYTMYGMRHHCHWKEMPNLSNDPLMGEVLKDVLWINLSKMPGRNSSGDMKYAKSYKETWSIIVKEQVRVYAPDVMIFGNCLDVCWSDFMTKDEWKNPIPIYDANGRHYLSIYCCSRQLILHAFHPSYPGMSEEFYVDSIIDAVDMYYPHVLMSK